MHLFDKEVHSARQVILDHGDDPADFTFTATPLIGAPGRHAHSVGYAVLVCRGRSRPASYQGGNGRNWVVLFAHDLGAQLFASSLKASLADWPGATRGKFH